VSTESQITSGFLPAQSSAFDGRPVAPLAAAVDAGALLAGPLVVSA
jgi:hypothetical protein